MGFKEELLRKIRILTLSRAVQSTIGPVGSGLKVDKNAMRDLLGMAGYGARKERDLELYVKEDVRGETRVFVLDNELPVYRTTVADVALRKSPTVKEMISIRNAIRILNDSDVLISKRSESLAALTDDLLNALDLRYGRADVDSLAVEGSSALERHDADGVQEILLLFAELSGYVPPPGIFRMEGQTVWGRVVRDREEITGFGPVVLFDAPDNRLCYREALFSSRDPDLKDQLHMFAQGRDKRSVAGAAVFEQLADNAMAAAQTGVLGH